MQVLRCQQLVHVSRTFDFFEAIHAPVENLRSSFCHEQEIEAMGGLFGSHVG